MKAVFFDLDDTLLWDEKSVRTTFAETCLQAEKKYGLDPEELKQLFGKRRENCTCLTRHTLIQ